MGKIVQTMEIPVVENVEVLVCGGGPAGLAAAVEAARNGAKTLVVERGAFLGGTATSAMMAMIVLPPDKLRGFPKEFFDRLAADGKAGRSRAITWDIEAYKILADRMLLDSGAEVLFNTWVSDAIVENGTIAGVVVENKSGRQYIAADIVIDATGDGDVAFRAGVPWVKGREDDGKMRPVTALALFGNVNLIKLKKYVDSHAGDIAADPLRAFCDLSAGEMRYDGFFSVVEKAKEQGVMRSDAPVNYLRFSAMVPADTVASAQVVVNSTRIYDIDGTDARDLSKAEIEGRRQLQEVYDACRAFLPGFESCVWAATAPLLGVRETRRVVGQYTLTYEDIEAGIRFGDTVATMTATDYGRMEMHSPDKGQEGSKNDTLTREMALEFIDFHFPLRAMLPEKIDNLIVAGRCCSMTHDADKFTRGMAMVGLMGQSAGLYAARRVRGETSVADLQAELTAKGVMAEPT